MSTFGPMAYNNGSYHDYDDHDDQPCRSCQSFALKTDWAQGDRVCTNCGVVDEGQLIDTRPEWTTYQDDEGTNKARSGMQAMDESKYLGGLQPTSFSTYIFGGTGPGDSTRRKQLLAINKKMDHSMEKKHKHILELAKVDRLVRLKHGNTTIIDNNDQDSGIRPDHDQLVENAILKEEEQAAHQALYGDKWSLERALFLHGEEASELSNHQSRDDLLKTMDPMSKKASSTLYQAQSILKEGFNALRLPDRVLQESLHMLVQYAIKKDGLGVKGVASRISENKNNNDGNINKDQAEISLKLRDFNRKKQSSALSCALLYMNARKLGHTRSVQEVVNTFSHIKVKHCSKAMAELKQLFPEFAKPATLPRTGLVEHATRKLELPPVATVCIQTLVQYLEQQHFHVAKPSTLCASVTYFVCQAGDIMQALAKQSQETKYRGSRKRALEDKNDPDTVTTSPRPTKKRFDIFTDAPIETCKADTIDYEMRLLWDAWSEQMAWIRTLAQVEQAFGVPRKLLFDFFVKTIFPKRTELLQLLAKSAAEKGGLADTPRAAILLSNIVAAAGLMKSSTASHLK